MNLYRSSVYKLYINQLSYISIPCCIIRMRGTVKITTCISDQLNRNITFAEDHLRILIDKSISTSSRKSLKEHVRLNLL